MKALTRLLSLATAGVALLEFHSLAQTDGSARMAVTLNDYNGAGASHWTVAWVTTESGAFIKTLWKQGTKYAFSSSQWTTHCPEWNLARGGPGGSTVVDGYTSATATSYTGTNSPVILTWNGRDANNVLVPDGGYKFWVQYAEDRGAGPYTTNGLLWTKGPVGATNTYADLSPNFTGMQVAWVPNPPSAIAPSIMSAPLPATGNVGVPYRFTGTATGTAPVNFTASGLPPGLTLAAGGLLSGIPIQAGTFTGTITAANGTLPNASQPFTIVVGTAPVVFAPALISGKTLILSGTGPANGVYTLLAAPSLLTPAPWTPAATNSFDAAGQFRFTNTLDLGPSAQFYRLRVP